MLLSSLTGVLQDVGQLDLLRGTYAAIFDGVKSTSVTQHFQNISSIKFAGEQYGSCDSRGECPCFVMATWCSLGGRIDVAGLDLWPGMVSYYLLHNIEIGDQNVTCVLAAVRWFSKHPQRMKLGAPAEVWCRSIFELEGSASFIPVQRIYILQICPNLWYDWTRTDAC